MAALIKSSVRYGTSRSRHAGTWILSSPTQEHPGILAEGPALNHLLASTPVQAMRPATPLERLLGHPAPDPEHLP